MIKYRIWYLIMSITLIAACNTTDTNSTTYKIKNIDLPQAFSSPNTISYSDKLLQFYIDSINTMKPKDEWPNFIHDSIDVNATFWDDFHHPKSTRKQIIDQVNNQEVLQRMIKSNSSSLNMTYSDTTIPYYNYSWRNLAKERLEVLLDSLSNN